LICVYHSVEKFDEQLSRPRFSLSPFIQSIEFVTLEIRVGKASPTNPLRTFAALRQTKER